MAAQSAPGGSNLRTPAATWVADLRQFAGVRGGSHHEDGGDARQATGAAAA